MMAKEELRDHFQSSGCYGKRILEDRNAKRKLNDIVIIDVEGDRFDNVIVIDDNESESKSSNSNMRQHKKASCVICVEDDDNDEAGCQQTSVHDGGDFDSDASSSRRPFPTSSSKPHTIDVDDNEIPFVNKKRFAFKFARCRQKSFRKVPARSRYGLSFNIYTGSSESDGSDCEVIDGSSEKLQEQWRKASQKRKTSVYVDKSRVDDQASASSFPIGTKFNANTETRMKQDLPSHFYGSPNNVECEEEYLYAFFETGDDFAFTTLNPRNRGSFMESDQMFDQENHASTKPGFGGEPCSNHVMPGERMSSGDPSPSSGNWGCEKVCYGVTCCKDKECSSERHLPLRANIERGETTDDAGTLLRKDNEFSCSKLACGHTHNLISVNHTSNSLQVEAGKAGSLHGEKLNNVFNFHHGEERLDSMKITLDMETKVLSDSKNLVQISKVSPCVETSIINGREMLKESDEYKAAVEEEWASRQRELQIQAEESQRQRKRRKAETLRLLDVQRRQKERLEEVRETQKKDEENMNLKEKIRAEIINALSELEASADMASLLRGLGIQVGRGLIPLSQEVQAAYKRALFKFHPDRASRMDIREQVEAEEKFKLISRMKEKFQL